MKPILRVPLVAFAGGAANMILHGILSPLQPADLPQTPGFFEAHGLLVPAICCWELLAFTAFALTFLLLEARMGSSSLVRGLLFGAAVGGLYFVGMFESLLLLGTAPVNEALMGVADLASFLIAGLILGRTGYHQTRSAPRLRALPGVVAVATIAGCYLAGRLLGAALLGIRSAWVAQPLGTLCWTLSLGVWVGVMYLLLEPALPHRPLTRASSFALGVFGTTWLINHLFIGVAIGFSLDLVERVAVDTVSVWLAVIMIETISQRFPRHRTSLPMKGVRCGVPSDAHSVEDWASCSANRAVARQTREAGPLA